MTNSIYRGLRRATLATALVASLATLSGCFGGDDDDEPIAMPPPTPTPTPTATPTPTSFNVQRCLDQMIPGTGLTVAQAVVPDTLKLNLSAASGFPNGRRLTDPVIDVTLAVIFLDLTVHSPGALAGLPLNPPANDRQFRSTFPYLASPQGSAPLADNTGTMFTFRSDPVSNYVRVDRMGMPAVSTALIGSSRKNIYNDTSPAGDATGAFVPDLRESLTTLTNALADDLTGANLTPCARPQ
jgi:hypothetical protein